MKISRRNLLIGALCAASSPWSFAQAYPNAPITMVVAFGGGGEQLYRNLAKRMGELLGQSVIVMSEPGGAGVIAANRIAGARPDGYTVFASHFSAQVLKPLSGEGVKYHPIRDFTYISQVTEPVLVLAVNKKMPINTVAELAAYAEKNPGPGLIGVQGIGGTADLTVGLMKAAGAKSLDTVPYKDDSQALVDLTGGSIGGVISTASSVRPFVQQGHVKVIAVFSEQRQEAWEGVPTMSEQLPGFVPLRAFTGILGPAGIPRSIVDRLNKAITEALNDPTVNAAFVTAGSRVKSSTPEEFAAMVAGEVERLSSTVLRQPPSGRQAR